MLAWNLVDIQHNPIVFSPLCYCCLSVCFSLHHLCDMDSLDSEAEPHVQGIQADRTTSSIKSQRSKSTSKNDTYELHKSSVDVPGNNKDAAFEIDVPTITSAKLSDSFEDGKGKKHWSSHSESMRNGASHRESTLHLDSVSGAWNSSSNSIDDDFEPTDGVNVLGRLSSTPIHFRTKRNSTTKFNKQGTISRTPLRLKIPVEDNTLPKISKRLRVQKETVASPIIKKPNSSTASKKRTKVLLSGHKPGSLLKKSVSKQMETKWQKRTSTKKQLKHGEGPSSASSRHKQKCHKKTSSTTTGKKTKNRFGFKLVNNSSLNKKELLMAVVNKKRPLKSVTAEIRNEIEGVRSNRRFDLLMKMRQKSQK